MNRLTARNIVGFINQLPKNLDYNYINPRNKGLIRISRVELPEGPIYIKRFNPSNGESPNGVKEVSISVEMIWRLANAFIEGEPLNVDRILGASYNTRSVLESLIAHTPQFYFGYPGRIQDIAGHTSIEHGHKHLVWLPEIPHSNGMLQEKEFNVAISEIPVSQAVYDNLLVPDTIDIGEVDIDVARRHTQIQIALMEIGQQLNFRTWIAQNDKGILYQDKPLLEHTGVVKSLNNEKLVATFDGAVSAGNFIDCIWFKNGKLMPAVMEVEHSTGVTSGLTRMVNFKDKIPAFPTRYVIVAPDELREKVVYEANKEMFKELDTKFFPYSAVEELYVICKRRKLRGVTEEFLDCYMEPIVSVS